MACFTFFLYVSSILSHLYSNYLILFCSSVSYPLSLSIPFYSLLFINLMSSIFPFHSKYLIFFCINLMPIISFHSIQSISFSFVYQSRPLSLSITFILPHFLLFINLMSIVSDKHIPCKWSHSVLSINLMFIILGTPFHLNYLITRMIVSGTPIPFLSHSLSFINLTTTYSIQISYSIKLFINFIPIISFHSNYFPLFISLMSTIPGTPFPFKLSHHIVSGTPIPFLSHSPLFVNLMPFISGTRVPIRWSHSLLFINLMHIMSDTSNFICIRNRSSPEVSMLVFQMKGYWFNWQIMQSFWW